MTVNFVMLKDFTCSILANDFRICKGLSCSEHSIKTGGMLSGRDFVVNVSKRLMMIDKVIVKFYQFLSIPLVDLKVDGNDIRTARYGKLDLLLESLSCTRPYCDQSENILCCLQFVPDRLLFQ